MVCEFLYLILIQMTELESWKAYSKQNFFKTWAPYTKKTSFSEKIGNVMS